MKKKTTYILISILISVFILLQFFRPGPIPQIPHSPSDGFVAQTRPPEKIAVLLKVACYDCHSYQSRQPWYSKIQPVYSYMFNHMQEGERAFNFDTFGQYSKRKQKSKVKSMYKQIEDDLMPLKSYTLVNSSARLSPQQKKELLDWLMTLEKGFKKKDITP